MEYRYTAIVLGKREAGETDRLYTLYTKEAGKITTMAKGVRKPTAKLASQLENGSQVGVTVIKGRGMGKLAGAIAEERFLSLRSDYTVYQKFLATLDRVRLLTEPEESDQELFDLLQQFLVLSEELLVQKNEEQFYFLRECFLLQLYSLLGYHIDTNFCAATGEKLTRGQKYIFSPRDGACVLATHSKNYPHSVVISEDTLVMLRLILHNSLASLLKVVNGPKETKALENLSESFYRWTIRH